MTDSGQNQAITQADVASLAEKLGDWSAQLPEREQALLQYLIARGQGSEVQAYGMGEEGEPEDLGDLVTRALEPLVEGGGVVAKPKWIRIITGPAWLRSGGA